VNACKIKPNTSSTISKGKLTILVVCIKAMHHRHCIVIVVVLVVAGSQCVFVVAGSQSQDVVITSVSFCSKSYNLDSEQICCGNRRHTAGALVYTILIACPIFVAVLIMDSHAANMSIAMESPILLIESQLTQTLLVS
jgi:hypothetical protein